jgi:hypothetical protein
MEDDINGFEINKEGSCGLSLSNSLRRPVAVSAPVVMSIQIA